LALSGAASMIRNWWKRPCNRHDNLQLAANRFLSMCWSVQPIFVKDRCLC